MFPLDKYVYCVKRNKVLAYQTYAGKVYCGKATCAPNDEFNFEIGKKLAAARCNFKIAKARANRAWGKCLEARDNCDKAVAHYEKMKAYRHDSLEQMLAAQELVDEVTEFHTYL